MKKTLLCLVSLISFSATSDACDKCCQPKCCSESKIIYKDTHRIAPCAVEKKIKVEIFNSCTCKCEEIEVSICVPKCDCFETKCRKNGTKYDYGKYEVAVTTKNGIVTVDYNT